MTRSPVPCWARFYRRSSLKLILPRLWWITFAAASLLQRDLDVPPEGAAAAAGCEEANFLLFSRSSCTHQVEYRDLFLSLQFELPLIGEFHSTSQRSLKWPKRFKSGLIFPSGASVSSR
uniref:(northern house mosquito) hypothetical protein n=1 Tax=Culex pipiens TaxID=7175 RepID=A0A8D8IE71_CULPI